MWFVLPALASPIPPQSLPTQVQTIAVGSCAHSAVLQQPVWKAVRRSDPDLLLLLGDVVYADTEDADELGKALERLGRRPRFRRMARFIPILHTWDDHDFGPNDSDARHQGKEGVRDVTLDFYGASATDPRRTQEGGLYGTWTMGAAGQRVQVVLLDTRWDLSPRAPRSGGGEGRYAPGPGQVLGDAQWAWLEEVLQQPADLRIIGSSIPFAAEYTGWETWSNFPNEQQRLTEMLQAAGPVVVVSGDVHYGELSRHEGLYDLTSSGLAGRPYPALPNANRQDGFVTSSDHFAVMEMDWAGGTVTMRWVGARGHELATKTLPLHALDAEP